MDKGDKERNKEKNDLILKLFDRNINAEEFQQLQDLMRKDPEMKALYYEHVLLEHSLADMFGEKILSPTAHKVRPASQSMYRRHVKIAALAAVACLVIGLLTARFFQTAPQPVMTEMRFSENSEWSLSGGEGAEGKHLSPGRELIIERGTVELNLPRGVRAIVEAPAKLVMKNETELYLHQGRGSFTVPEEGVGFTVTTSRLRAVDRGTKFGVVSNWGESDQVHVIKGLVRVANKLKAAQELQAGDAVSVNSKGVITAVDCREALYLLKLPQSVKTLAEDDFEIAKLKDGERLRSVRDWNVTGDRTKFGTLNPNGQQYYNQPLLNDPGKTGGIYQGMQGPSLCYYFGKNEGALEREVGKIMKDSTYTVSLCLGVRAVGKAAYAGYDISLMSGDTILAKTIGRKEPCDRNSFQTVVLNWSSSKLPHNVYSGDPLTVRIGTVLHDGKTYRYLDFDSFHVNISPE